MTTATALGTGSNASLAEVGNHDSATAVGNSIAVAGEGNGDVASGRQHWQPPWIPAQATAASPVSLGNNDIRPSFVLGTGSTRRCRRRHRRQFGPPPWSSAPRQTPPRPQRRPSGGGAPRPVFGNFDLAAVFGDMHGRDRYRRQLPGRHPASAMRDRHPTRARPGGVALNSAKTSPLRSRGRSPIQLLRLRPRSLRSLVCALARPPTSRRGRGRGVGNAVPAAARKGLRRNRIATPCAPRCRCTRPN